MPELIPTQNADPAVPMLWLLLLLGSGLAVASLVVWFLAWIWAKLELDSHAAPTRAQLTERYAWSVYPVLSVGGVLGGWAASAAELPWLALGLSGSPLLAIVAAPALALFAVGVRGVLISGPPKSPNS